MILLTDRPEAAAELLGADVAWRDGVLDAEDARLAEALAAGRPLRRGAVVPAAGAGAWSRLVLVGEAESSQYDRLRELYARTPPAEPLISLALAGRGFHGHRGRSWRAEAGNLHLCAAAPVGAPASTVGLALTMLPAVAVVDAVRVACGGLAPGIKWVNDILVAGRKVAGVLTAGSTRANLVEMAVFGIGINVARAPAVPPTVFVPEIGCLADAAGASGGPGLAEVLWPLLAALADRLASLRRDGPGPLAADYRARSLVPGRAVRVWDEGIDETADPRTWPEPLARGVVRDIAPDLSLLLEGRPEPVGRGRLALEEVCRRLGL